MDCQHNHVKKLRLLKNFSKKCFLCKEHIFKFWRCVKCRGCDSLMHSTCITLSAALRTVSKKNVTTKTVEDSLVDDVGEEPNTSESALLDVPGADREHTADQDVVPPPPPQTTPRLEVVDAVARGRPAWSQSSATPEDGGHLPVAQLAVGQPGGRFVDDNCEPTAPSRWRKMNSNKPTAVIRPRINRHLHVPHRDILQMNVYECLALRSVIVSAMEAQHHHGESMCSDQYMSWMNGLYYVDTTIIRHRRLAAQHE